MASFLKKSQEKTTLRGKIVPRDETAWRLPGHRYCIDHAPHFVGVFDPVPCTFRPNGGALVAESITIGTRIHRPSERANPER